MKKINLIICIFLFSSVIAPFCSAGTFDMTMDVPGAGEEPTGNLTADFLVDVNYTTYTVIFTDNSSSEGDVNITWWTWDFGDEFYVSGMYGEHQNPVHTYIVNWSLVDANASTVLFTVMLEVENMTQNEYDWISKDIVFTRPEAPSEVYFELPMELIVAMISVIIIIVLVYVFLNVTEGVFKR